jgi:hypothetical protein
MGVLLKRQEISLPPVHGRSSQNNPSNRECIIHYPIKELQIQHIPNGGESYLDLISMLWRRPVDLKQDFFLFESCYLFGMRTRVW